MSAEPITDLAQARAIFDEWCAQRPGPGRLPEHLWALAESLVPHYAAPLVARELGLNPGRLRARLERTPSSSKRRVPKPAFVELRAIDLVPPQATGPDAMPPPHPTLEVVVTARIERPDGTRPGFNIGTGINFPLTDFTALAEVRLHVVLTEGKPILTLPLSVGAKF